MLRRKKLNSYMFWRKHKVEQIIDMILKVFGLYMSSIHPNQLLIICGSKRKDFNHF